MHVPDQKKGAVWPLITFVLGVATILTLTSIGVYVRLVEGSRVLGDGVSSPPPHEMPDKSAATDRTIAPPKK